MQRKLKIQDHISKEAIISATILIFNQQYKRRGGEMFGFRNIRYCQNKTTRKDLNLKLVQTTCPLLLPNKTHVCKLHAQYQSIQMKVQLQSTPSTQMTKLYKTRPAWS